MLITPEEKRRMQKCLLKISQELAELEKIILNATILGIPEPEEDMEIEHVGYTPEQCARDK